MEGNIIKFPGPRDELYDLLKRAQKDSHPVLIEGPVGCGKSSLVRYLARSYSLAMEENMITVQMSEDMDGKVI